MSARDAVPVTPYFPPPSLPVAAVIYAEVAPVTEAPNRQPREMAAQELSARLLQDLAGQVLTAGQQVVFELQGVNLRLTVGSLTADGQENGSGGRQQAGQQRAGQPPQQQHREVPRAAVAPGGATSFIFTNSNASAVRVTGQKGIATTALFKQRQLNFESLGIGGLDSQFEAIFRRAFASRVFPPSVLERLGIHHVKVRPCLFWIVWWCFDGRLSLFDFLCFFVARPGRSRPVVVVVVVAARARPPRSVAAQLTPSPSPPLHQPNIHQPNKNKMKQQGMLLYGPPGTGKTLIARQIGKMLNGREPKVVNGPEVLSKYVGQAEENVRALFAEAEAEYKEKGDQSELHIIIFDEIDAICKQRGSVRDGTATHDTIVNQLLTKVDGVDALNNILLIGE